MKKLDVTGIMKRVEERSSMISERKYKKECIGCGKTIDYYNYDDYINSGYAIYCSAICEKLDNDKFYMEIIKKTFPSKYLNINADNKELLEKSMNKSLFITGNVGSGKTVFATSLGKEYIMSGEGVHWISYPSFIMKLQNAFMIKEQDEDTAYDIASRVAKYKGILIIDDFGAERLTDFVRQITYYIVNEREQYVLQTIITSNYSLKNIDEQIDRRISSRIAGMCEVLKFPNIDRRLIKNEKE